MKLKYTLLLLIVIIVIIVFTIITKNIQFFYFLIKRLNRLFFMMITPLIIKYIRHKYKFVDKCIGKNNNWVFTIKNKKQIIKFFRRKKQLKKELTNYSNIKQYDISPNIIKFNINKRYIIYDKLDIGLYELFTENKLENKHIKGIIKLLRTYADIKFKHDDLHLHNFMWDNKNNKFKIIDWEYNYILQKDKYNIEDNYYIKFLLNLCIIPRYYSKKQKFKEFHKLRNIKQFLFNYFTKIYKKQIPSEQEKVEYNRYINILKNDLNIPPV